MNKISSMENWQRASVIVSVVLSLALLVNTSLTAYITYQDTFTASFQPTGKTGESLEIDAHGTVGRPSPLIHYLNNIKDWISSYAVGGVEKTNAQTGITISITGSNVASTASVDYYIEGVPQSGGSSYRFLEGNSTSVTVSGADLDLTNETSIETHLSAMGLSTDTSHTIDYYVYVKAEATGAISGDTLTSEITRQKFDTVTYQYGSEVTVDTYFNETMSISDYQDSKNKQVTCGDYAFGGYQLPYMRITLPDVSGVTEATFWRYICGTGGNTPRIHKLGTCDAWDYSTITWSNKPDFDTKLVEWTAGSNWDDASSDDLATYVENNAGQMVNWTMRDVSGGKTQGDGYNEDDAPYLRVKYLSYSSSWYPIGPVSVLSMPVGQLFSTLVLIGLAVYALYYASGGEPRWR